MKRSRSFLSSCLLYILGCLLLIVNEGRSQVTVRGGNITLTIATGIAGGQLTNVVNTITTLRYTKQARISKITVATACAGQRFNLQVVATSATRGTAQPAVMLINGNPAVDFIRDMPRTGGAGTCTLQYTASATFAQGNSTELGNDIHTVTYTIQAQ
jgi:hypothetical protein